MAKKTTAKPDYKVKDISLADWRSEEHTSELQSH